MPPFLIYINVTDVGLERVIFMSGLLGLFCGAVNGYIDRVIELRKEVELSIIFSQEHLKQYGIQERWPASYVDATDKYCDKPLTVIKIMSYV